MLARLAGRLLTSPVAFALGGGLDMLRFLFAAVRQRWRHRRDRSSRRSEAETAPPA